MRGVAIISLFNKARRSAFETTLSSKEIGRRWLTPERLSMRLSVRAMKATCSAISLISGGI
jgi:hypothetical protein